MALSNKESMLAPFDFEVPDHLAEKVMIDREIKGDANYVLANQETVELGTADLCGLLITMASEKEGDFAVTYDVNRLAKIQSDLLRKHGQSDSSVGQINAKSVW